MSKIVYIGADGGGTKTAIAVSDFSEKKITHLEGSSINYNFIGVEKAASNFADLIKRISPNKDIEIEGIAIGDPSLDDLNPSPLTEQFVSLIREKVPLSAKCPIHIKSDVYMTLYGTTFGKPGALIVSGTGSMGMAIDVEGNLHVIGGWGRLTEDEGSGYFVAVNGIKSALHYFDGTGPETILLKKMKEYFNTGNPRDFILRYYADPADFPEISGFSKVVGEAADTDTEARKILLRCADILTKNMIALFKKAGLHSCRIGIYGSVLLNNHLVRERFQNGVLHAYPHSEITVPSLSPEDAALKYILEKENL